MEEKIFKSFLRLLLRDLKDIKDLLENEETEKAISRINILINDTQKGVEE